MKIIQELKNLCTNYIHTHIFTYIHTQIVFSVDRDDPHLSRICILTDRIVKTEQGT